MSLLPLRTTTCTITNTFPVLLGMDGLNIHIYIGIYVYISEENKGKEIHKPLNFIMFVMNPLKLLTVWLLESQPVIFQTQQLRCICVLKSHLRYENRTCEVEVADAFWSRRCVLKSQLRFENASAAWTSQMRFSHRRCEIDIAAAERSQTLTSAGFSRTIPNMGAYRNIRRILVRLLSDYESADF